MIVRPELTKAYKLLDVKPDTPMTTITKVFRKLALKNHPDKKNGSKDKMQELNLAYKLIKEYHTKVSKASADISRVSRASAMSVDKTATQKVSRSRSPSHYSSRTKMSVDKEPTPTPTPKPKPKPLRSNMNMKVNRKIMKPKPKPKLKPKPKPKPKPHKRFSGPVSMDID